MKRFYLPMLAIICTIAMLSFSNKPEAKSKFVCQWFIYDDPAITNPSLDFPSTATQAKTQANYRLAISISEVNMLCPASLRLCAICAEVDPSNLTKPLLTSGQTIVTEIDNYFSQPLDTRQFTSTGLGREKFSL